MAWRRDALFIRQRSTRKVQVHMFGEGKKFAEAYKARTGKNK